jgi:endonuclease YncB( thermonuclease family)
VKRWLLLSSIALTACAPAVTDPNAVPENFACTVALIAAGDRVVMSCEGQGLVQVQVAGIIAPSAEEPGCELERVLARSSRLYAENLFDTADSVRVIPEAPQAGLRTARFLLDGQDFGNRMIDGNHALPFTDEPPRWCILP